VSITSTNPTADDPGGIAQVLAVNSADGQMYHAKWGDRRFASWAVPLRQPPVVRDAAIAIAQPEPGDQDPAHVVCLRRSDGVLFHSIRYSDNKDWQDWRTPAGPGSQPQVAGRRVAVTNLPGTSDIGVAVIDMGGQVLVGGRRQSGGTWIPWGTLPPPQVGLSAEAVAVFGIPKDVPADPHRVMVVAAFSDTGLHFCYCDLAGAVKTRSWRPLPYPATAQFVTTALALGRSPDVCDPDGSAAVWFTSKRRAQRADADVHEGGL
jgi:hypothetical protein